MNVLFPAFLIGGLAIAIPIALHFLRRDVAPEVPFSAVRLLHRSPIARSRRRRLRDLILLAARVSAILLLALAFARPYSAGAGASSPVLIVAVDRSFSMGAPGRFERALELARTAVDGAGMADRVAVVAFDDRADLIAAPGSAGDARVALAELRPGSGGTRYGPMLAKAAEAADGSGGRLVVVTDLQRAGWEDERRVALPDALALDILDVGPPPPNAGVTDVRTERDRLVAYVQNAGPPRGGRVRVLRDGVEVAQARYSAAADAVFPVGIPMRVPASGALAVAVDDETGAAADNQRHILLDAGRGSSVLVVTSAGSPRSGFYLSRAVAAGSGEEDGPAVGVRVLSGAQASALPPDEIARQAAVVLLATRGLDRRARQSITALVRGGAGMLVAAGQDVEQDVLSTMFGWQPALSGMDRDPQGATLAPTDLRHPIFRPFGPLAVNLGQVRFSRTWDVRADGWEVVARFTDGTPALLERREGSGRIVLFASDVDRRWNDFPVHASFVPFVSESIRYVATAFERAGAYTIGHTPAGVPPTPGVHVLPDTGRVVVVNVDTRESGTSRLTRQEFEGMVDRVSLASEARAEVRARQVESRQSWWRLGLMVMLGVLVVESVIGRA